jgi:hypothetical protein
MPEAPFRGNFSNGTRSHFHGIATFSAWFRQCLGAFGRSRQFFVTPAQASPAAKG